MSTVSDHSSISVLRKSSLKPRKKQKNLMSYALIGGILFLSGLALIFMYNSRNKEKKEERREKREEEDLLRTSDRVDNLSRELSEVKTYLADFIAPMQQPYYNLGKGERVEVKEEEDNYSIVSSESSSDISIEETSGCSVRLSVGKRKGELCGKQCVKDTTMCSRHLAQIKIREDQDKDE